MLGLPHELSQRPDSSHQRSKETHPALFEAILGTEIAVLHAQLQTRRTLQGFRFIVTVDSETLSLGGQFGCEIAHGG